jgi:putative resolvase
VNLTEWEHARGINGTAACRWCQEGTRPVPARTASRLILVSPQTTAATSRQHRTGLYVRVSCHDQRAGLYRQVARLPAWGGAGRSACGLGGGRGRVTDERRPGRGAAAAGRSGGGVVAVGHRDRPERMTAGLAGAARGRCLVVLGEGGVTGGLGQPVVELLTWLCARRYGRRPALQPGAEGRWVRPAGHRLAGRAEGGERLVRGCRVSRLRRIAGPFVAAAPALARVRTWLRVSAWDEAVLWAVGSTWGRWPGGTWLPGARRGGWTRGGGPDRGPGGRRR